MKSDDLNDTIQVVLQSLRDITQRLDKLEEKVENMQPPPNLMDRTRKHMYTPPYNIL